MTFMRKIIDILNMDNWDTEDNVQKTLETNEKEKILSFLQSKIESANRLIDIARNTNNKDEFDKYVNEIKLLFSEFQTENKTQAKNSYDKYYDNINKQKENNLHITYEDVKIYDKKPFDLGRKFISDEHFTAIELSDNNLKIAYNYLEEINKLLLPYKYLYKDAEFPNKISVEYILNRKLPVSHLRLIPYTATKRKSKYPLGLWLSNSGDYGTEYIYVIYFDKNGKIGQCELSLHGADGIGISYETKIRRNESGLYILRISKTLYSPPYGTTTIYHHKNSVSTSNKPNINNEYDLERYARECNSYIIREERKEKEGNND